MTPQIKTALAAGVKAAEWLESAKPQQLQMQESRLVLAVAFFSIALEHHLAILRLFQSRLPSSAFALLRSVVDAYVRGEWAAKIATEGDADKFMQGKLDPKPDFVIKRLRQLFPDLGDPLEELKRLGWTTWSGFTHAGHSQLSNWISNGAIGPIHSEENCIKVIQFATRLAFLSALSLVDIAKEPPGPFFDKAREFGLLDQATE